MVGKFRWIDIVVLLAGSMLLSYGVYYRQHALWIIGALLLAYNLFFAGKSQKP